MVKVTDNTNQENVTYESDSLCPMIIIFNVYVFLDLAPREVIFNIGLMALQWPQSQWPLHGPIGLRSINN